MKIHYHPLTSGKLSNFSIAWFLLSFSPCTQSRAHQKTHQRQTKCCLLQHFCKEQVLLGEATKKNKKKNNPHLTCTFNIASMHKLLREKRCVQISYISKLKRRFNEEGNLHSQVGYISFRSYVFLIKMQFLVNNAHLRFLSG